MRCDVLPMGNPAFLIENVREVSPCKRPAIFTDERRHELLNQEGLIEPNKIDDDYHMTSRWKATLFLGVCLLEQVNRKKEGIQGKTGSHIQMCSRLRLEPTR